MADAASVGGRPRVLVTPASLCERRDLLAPVSDEIDLVFHPQAVPANMSGYVGVVLGNEEFGSAAFATADRLRLVARYGVTVHNVDLALAREHGVVVTCCPRVSASGAGPSSKSQCL
jgi:phosphoglycerate dehydrogenase-like enzyme